MKRTASSPLADEVRQLNEQNARTRTDCAAGKPLPPIEWVWCTWTILGERFRFQGRKITETCGDCLPYWYVHVSRLNTQTGTYTRVSYGYEIGAFLPDVARSWAAQYIECGAHLN